VANLTLIAHERGTSIANNLYACEKSPIKKPDVSRRQNRCTADVTPADEPSPTNKNEEVR
jgi:hypothetical protein